MVTATYSLARLFVSHFLDGVTRPFCGQLYGIKFPEVIEGTVNFTPKNTPGENQKELIDDMRINYFVTDNTVRNIEKAYLIAAAQPTTAALGEVSNSERGEIGWKEVDMQFNGIPLVGPAITAKARSFLDWINKNTVFEESKFGYRALSEMADPGQTGGIDVSSPTVDY